MNWQQKRLPDCPTCGNPLADHGEGSHCEMRECDAAGIKPPEDQQPKRALEWCTYHNKPARDGSCEDDDGTYGNHCVLGDPPEDQGECGRED